MKDYIIIDLDGTLCNVDHRVDFAKVGLWEDFHAKCYDDVPHQEILQFIQMADSFCGIIATTGRNAKYRDVTIAWLAKYKAPVDLLLMRPDMNFESDSTLKLSMIERHFGSKQDVLDNVAFCLDDRDKVVEAFRNYGLPCWQVREGAF